MNKRSVIKTNIILFTVLFSYLAAAAAGEQAPLTLQIVADTDRDGVIDFSRDLESKRTWSKRAGAIFMVNNDSDQDNGAPDHADSVVNGPDDLLDLAPLSIKRIPHLTGDAALYVSVPEAARAYVRLFYKSANDYHVIKNLEKQELPVRLLRDSDLELRIEALSYACPQWDGSVTVSVELRVRGKTYSDEVCLKAAPFIMLSAVQPAKWIYVRHFPGKNEDFIRRLEQLTTAVGVQLKTIPAGTYDAWNIWLQDVMEVGYTMTPTRCMPVVLKANRGKSLDDMPRQRILGPDHGWFELGKFNPQTGQGRGGDSWLDWYGNLEVTPPLPGKPFGRIFYGYNKRSGRAMNPQIVDVLAAQGVQTPLIKIHTGWLLIKHVDEIFNFVRVSGGKGFKVLVPDIEITYRLLDQWHAQGKGNLAILKGLKENETVASLLNDKELRKYNIELQQTEIEESIGMMKRAIGIDERDIIRIPALFKESYGYAAAAMPNMVNSVHLDGHQLIADPHGPVEQGRDLLQEYVKNLLKKENIDAHFIDDKPYHTWHGNVHCATNVTYQPYDTPWWKER